MRHWISTAILVTFAGLGSATRAQTDPKKLKKTLTGDATRQRCQQSAVQPDISAKSRYACLGTGANAEHRSSTALSNAHVSPVDRAAAACSAKVGCQ